MPGSIAGATTTGAALTSAISVTASSAKPSARRAMVVAVAGAMTTTSAARPSSTWAMRCSGVIGVSAVTTGRWVSASNVIGATNCSAPRESAASTCAPACVSALASSAAL